MGMLRTDDSELLSRIATNEGHGENCSYFDGWKAYDSDPFHPVHNPNGVIQMGLAENQLCLDLIQDWLKRNPEASICTAEGVSQFRDIANFQDCHALPLFRKAIARFMEKARGGRARFDPDRIVMSGGDTGAQETMAFCLADPGEVFLIPNPYYPGFDQDFRWRTGVELMPFDCYSSNKFRITQSALETAYEEAVKNNKKVKGVLVANPSNPLGTTMDRETLRSLVSFVNDKKIHLVVDEIFSGTVFDSPRFVSVAEIVEDEPGRFNRDLIHVVYSVSKDLGLPGFRVGVIYSFNDAVVRCARRMSSFGLVSTQTQHLLAAMLGDEEFTSQFLAESRRRLPERRRAFEAGLRKVGVRSLDSNAGLFCWMDLRHLLKAKTVDEELKLWRMIVHEVKLNISPGASFHCAESGWFKSCRYEVAHLLEKIGHLETSKRNILGENLESHSLEELVELETKLENSLRSIRARKYQLLEQQLVQLQKEESHLMEQNELLREQCKLQPELPFAISKEVPYGTATQQNEVETELCIGCPGRGNRTSAIPI